VACRRQADRGAHPSVSHASGHSAFGLDASPPQWTKIWFAVLRWAAAFPDVASAPDVCEPQLIVRDHDCGVMRLGEASGEPTVEEAAGNRLVRPNRNVGARGVASIGAD
jgi:hypothetical protein